MYPTKEVEARERRVKQGGEYSHFELFVHEESGEGVELQEAFGVLRAYKHATRFLLDFPNHRPIPVIY